MFTVAVLDQQAEPPMDVSHSFSDGIKSLSMAQMEIGISSDGLALAPMEVNCNFFDGFNFDRLAVAQMELNSSSFDGFSFDDSVVALGKIDMIDPQLLMVIFLAYVLKRPSDAGFVDFGVNGVDKVGSESSVHLIQGMDDKYTRPIDV